MTDAVRQRLQEEFPDYRVVPFPESTEAIERLTDRSTVVACGGDGTVATVARKLAGTDHVLGIIPMGTFNNFARSLGIPIDFEEALDIVKNGEPRGCKLGKAGGVVFLEAALVGWLGQVIELGEAAKDLHFGEIGEAMARHRGGVRFRYRISGDVMLTGQATSIVVANTPSTGALIPIGESRPTDPMLELRIMPVATLRSRLATVLRLILRRRPPGRAHHVTRVRIETTPDVPAVADATATGTTPVDVEAAPNALYVLLPKSPAP